MPDKMAVTIRASAALTSSYVSGTTVNCDRYDTAALYLTYAVNAAAVSNTGYAMFKIETSEDGTNFHPDGIVNNDSSVTAAANGLDTWGGKVHAWTLYHDTPGSTTATQYLPKILIDVSDAKWFRLSAKEAGELGKCGTCSGRAVFMREQ